MTAVAFWWVHAVTVQTYEGQGSVGPVRADAVSVACWVEDSAKLVRDTAGREVVSSARVFGPSSLSSQFKVGSLVTLPSGRISDVIQVSLHDSGSLNLGVDHVEIALL